MSDCRKAKDRIAAWAAGEIDASGLDAVKEHIAMCDDCRRNHRDIGRILEGAEDIRGEMASAMAEIDWDALAGRLADAGVRIRRASRPAPRRGLFGGLARPRWRPALAGILAGLIIGSAATLVLVRRGAGPRPRPQLYAASGEFIDNIDFEMARRETIAYLEKSEYVLLDLVEGSSDAVPGAPSAAARRARELLAEKKFFAPRLDDVRIIKARAICRQIDGLFLELVQLDETLSAEEAAKIRGFVEDRQLLLQIRLLKNELRESEI